jgi:hypothetical protein
MYTMAHRLLRWQREFRSRERVSVMANIRKATCSLLAAERVSNSAGRGAARD